MNEVMQETLNLLKSNDLMDRKRAIDVLKEWNYQLEMEDALTLLKEAAQIMPLSDEDWDDPSLALVEAACVFIHQDMVPTIDENLLKYSYQAANKMLSALILLNTPEAVTLYKKTFHQLCLYVQLIPAFDERKLIFEKRESTMTAIEAIVENDIGHHPWYEWYYHYLITIGLEKGYFSINEVPLNKEFISERLQFFFDQYINYDQEYSREFVYEAWKEPYYEVRYSIIKYLTLYGALSTDVELLELQFILKWKDPYLKLCYIELLWKRNLEVDSDKETIMEILTNNDGPHDAFHLLKKNKPDFLPSDPSFQSYFVIEEANNVFYNEAGIDKYPKEVEMMGSFEEKDPIYDDNLTYYVVRFRSDDPAFINKGWMRMLIGAYLTAKIPTAYHPEGLSDQYTDFIPWEDKSFAEHVEDFKIHLAEKHGTSEQNDIFYQAIPTFKRRNNTIALTAFLASIGLIWVNDWFVLGLILAPLWLLLTYLHAKKLEKNIAVLILPYRMEYYCFDGGTYIHFSNISEVKLEKQTLSKPERFLFLPLKKWHFNFYDYGGNIIYSIPRQYVQEEYFIPIFKMQTAHLSKPPIIEWEKENSIST